MGMDLGIKRETFGAPEDHSWLGSQHGTDNCEPGTIDGEAFLETWPTGIIPSGVALARRASDELVVPYDAASEEEGVDTFIGHLFTTTDLHGTTAATVGPVPVPILWHGKVVLAKLPANHGVDAAAIASAPLIHYV